MLSDRQAEFKSALSLIRTLTQDLDEMFGRLPKLLKEPENCRDQIIELGLALSGARSAFLDLQEANRDVRVSKLEPIE